MLPRLALGIKRIELGLDGQISESDWVGYLCSGRLRVGTPLFMW